MRWPSVVSELAVVFCLTNDNGCRLFVLTPSHPRETERSPSIAVGRGIGHCRRSRHPPGVFPGFTGPGVNGVSLTRRHTS